MNIKQGTTTASKLALSASEMELVCNAEWFLTKRNITDKVFEMFGIIAEEVKPMFADPSLTGLTASSPKIFKGENYQGLPWVMLDYPRIFGNEDIFAIRTMFWWANYFSVTLHLKGRYRAQLLESSGFNLFALKKAGLFVSNSKNEWMHEVSEGNYLAAKNLNEDILEQLVQEQDFIKIAYIVPLTAWDNAVCLIPEIYKKMLSLFGINYPTGETGL